MTAEALPEAASAEYLTGALRSAGVLGDGRVRDVTVMSARPTLLSHITRLGLAYDGAAPGAPCTVILKTGLPRHGAWFRGRQEVAFYTEVAPALTAALVPRCFDASQDEGAEAWHLLLEDLTDSHAVPTVWPLPPETRQCERIIDVWARFHAGWWDDPRLGASVGTRPNTEASNQRLKDLTGHFTRFVDTLGDRLSPERRALFERYLDAAPRLFARRWARGGMTIIHGDAHVWNCFLPRDGGPDVRLFDWDGWRVGVACTDLAYMMALHWYPGRRARLEQPLLDRYHETLLAHGVSGYDRRALGDDYRLSVLMQIATPVWQAAFDIPPVIWWSHFERITLAIGDLGCQEFLD